MSENKVFELNKPEGISTDPLSELLHNERQLIAEAVEAELQGLLSQYTALRDQNGQTQANAVRRI